jgi:hypothetical protein
LLFLLPKATLGPRPTSGCSFTSCK